MLLKRSEPRFGIVWFERAAILVCVCVCACVFSALHAATKQGPITLRPSYRPTDRPTVRAHVLILSARNEDDDDDVNSEAVTARIRAHQFATVTRTLCTYLIGRAVAQRNNTHARTQHGVGWCVAWYKMLDVDAMMQPRSPQPRILLLASYSPLTHSRHDSRTDKCSIMRCASQPLTRATARHDTTRHDTTRHEME